MLYLAWRNITRRLGQSVATGIIVFISVFALTASCVIVSSLEESISLSRERLGADIMVLPAGASADASSVLFTAQPINVYLPKTVCDEVSAVEGVERITPQFFTQTVDQSCCSVVGVTRIVGIDSESDFIVTPWLSGESRTSLDDNEILLGSAAPRVDGGGVAILGRTFEVAGTVEPTGTSVDETIFMNIDAARALAAESPYLVGLWEKTDPLASVSCVMVGVRDGFDAATVADAITQACVGTVAVTTSDMIVGVSSQMRVLEVALITLIGLLIVVAAFALTGRISALVANRKKELGLMRTLGISAKTVLASLALETGITTVLSAVAGIACACAAAVHAVGLLHESFNVPGSAPSYEVYCASAVLGLAFALVLNGATLVRPMIGLLRTDPQAMLSKGDL
ncbi:ABC transporter permease [Raoultibacter phocaeensis]|uniref:ABC transporter permease n=1 Tax=Raoultibacter phocaeensis TaxID=2479841 RepID=UPI0015D64F69|nr:FtsX-like permease family protein [Raoultibacter phocaeensis]